jgi:hypothetical protein
MSDDVRRFSMSHEYGKGWYFFNETPDENEAPIDLVAAADYDALAARVAELESDLRAGICAAMSGEDGKADAILSKHWPDRPQLPKTRRVNLLDAIAGPSREFGPSGADVDTARGEHE